ncbi:hypothetical protein CRUP_034042 [Coryphaenoides rupestris]|nr:hypothetical protein CRUP_034042 [Coryphaenoides rupestris]
MAWFPERLTTQAGVSGVASRRAITASTPILLPWRPFTKSARSPLHSVLNWLAPVAGSLLAALPGLEVFASGAADHSPTLARETEMDGVKIQHSDAFALVYAVDDPESPGTVKQLQAEILAVKEDKFTSMVVLRNKMDQCNSGERHVSTEDTSATVVELNWNYSMLEASVKDDAYVVEVFRELLQQAHLCGWLSPALHRHHCHHKTFSNRAGARPPMSKTNSCTVTGASGFSTRGALNSFFPVEKKMTDSLWGSWRKGCAPPLFSSSSSSSSSCSASALRVPPAFTPSPCWVLCMAAGSREN